MNRRAAAIARVRALLASAADDGARRIAVAPADIPQFLDFLNAEGARIIAAVSTHF